MSQCYNGQQTLLRAGRGAFLGGWGVGLLGGLAVRATALRLGIAWCTGIVGGSGAAFSGESLLGGLAGQAGRGGGPCMAAFLQCRGMVAWLAVRASQGASVWLLFSSAQGLLGRAGFWQDVNGIYKQR